MTTHVSAPPSCRESLAMAVVGALAGGVHLKAYCAHRWAGGGDPATDGLDELMRACDELGPSWQPLAEAARRLAATGVITAAHFRDAYALNPARLAQVWQATSGRRSRASWERVRVLLGLGRAL